MSEGKDMLLFELFGMFSQPVFFSLVSWKVQGRKPTQVPDLWPQDSGASVSPAAQGLNGARWVGTFPHSFS